ncbi:MAG TPA: hypothetical protein VGS16_16470 [Candidatus Dormibacteraeota bacterium]|nr:hypothetical protein [Candidatus Dormibacteraeota bacterium]
MAAAVVALMISSIASSIAGAHEARAAAPVAGGGMSSVVAAINRSQAVSPDPSKVNHPSGLIPQVHRGQNASRAITAGTNPNCTTCSPPLHFTRGVPVMGGLIGTPGHVTITPVYWAPTGYSYVTATYRMIVNGYLQRVAQASQTNTNVFSVSTQFYQQSSNVGAALNHIQYAITAGAEVDDPNAYPASGPGPGACTPAIGFTACVTDGALQTELRTRLTALGQPIDDAHLYSPTSGRNLFFFDRRTPVQYQYLLRLSQRRSLGCFLPDLRQPALSQPQRLRRPVQWTAGTKRRSGC